MRKIVLSAWLRLDGCIAGPDDKMDWLRGDAQMMEYEQSFVDAADTLLLGRKTFNDFSSYWQHSLTERSQATIPSRCPLISSGTTPAPSIR
jgi:dihydrofolate reductase